MRRGILWALFAALLIGLIAPWAMADPPPWAPAHGYRRHERERERVYVGEPRVYAPAPFVYSGVTYVPLRNVTALVGAALLWNSLRGRVAVTYNGRELGLVIGRPMVYYGDEEVEMAAPPLVMHDVVYVPAEFCDRYLGLPTRYRRGVIEFEGPEGWRTYRVASRPSGRVVRWESGRRPRVVYRPERVRPGRFRVRAREGRRHGRGWQAERGQGRGEGRLHARGGRGRGEGRGRGRGHGGGED